MLGTDKYPEGVVLDTDEICNILNDDTSEYCKRQGHAVSMASTNFRTGADALKSALFANPKKSEDVEKAQKINGAKDYNAIAKHRQT